MCTNHDRQHYAIDLRNLAWAITIDDVELASQLLDNCTYDGLASFMNQYDRNCGDKRLKEIDDLMRRAHKQRRSGSLTLAGEIVNRWDIEMDDMLPY